MRQFYTFLWLLNSELVFFKKSKTNITNGSFTVYYHILLEVQRILEPCCYQLKTALGLGDFLLDSKTFFFMFNTITFLVPEDALYFYKEEKYKCSLSKKAILVN